MAGDEWSAALDSIRGAVAGVENGGYFAAGSGSSVWRRTGSNLVRDDPSIAANRYVQFEAGVSRVEG